LANAAGALHLCDTPNILIIDCGTCLTVTWMQNRRLQGGSISPGLRMRYQALSQLTGQLPLIEPTKDPIEPTGKSTEGSIRSGVQHGMLAEIKEIIEQYCSTNEPLSVIVTGGDASYFVPRLKSLIFAEPFLTLMGLHEIYQFRLTHL
jgi:type III pantothenate kinase